MDNKNNRFKFKNSFIRKNFIKSEKGLALLLILILSPLIISIFTGFIIYTDFIQQKNRTKSFCYEAHYKYQYYYSQKLNKLLKMNSQAQRLRKKSRQLNKRILIAVGLQNPILLANIQRQLVAHKLKQMAFSAKQKTILTSLKRLNLRAKQFIKDKLTKESSTNLKIIIPSISLIRSPKHSLTPNYLTPIRYSQKQQSKTFWHNTINSESYTFHCSATLKKKGNDQWAPKLTNV